MRIKKYSNEDVVLAVKDSISYRQVLEKLHLKAAGGNYLSLKNLIKQLNLDISHFKHNGWNKDKKFGPKRKIEDYLSNNKSIQSFKLKKRLISEKMFDYKCQSCNLTSWLDKPIPLELHHIDGNHQNNNLSNLTLLCPNCHALTSNYRGKNISTKLSSALPD